MSLDGVKEIFLKTGEPGAGINPDTGYIYKWIEKVAAEYIYKGKDSSGNVFSIGTSGGAVGSWEDHAEGIRPINNKEIAVGRAGSNNGRESVFGEGDSYIGSSQGTVLSYDGVSYTDVTSIIEVDDINTIGFPHLNSGSMLYFASDVFDVDYIKHPGLKIKITQSANLGAGDIILEGYNGASWFEINHMSTNSIRPYNQRANEKFETATDSHYFYDQYEIHNTIQKTTVNGSNRFWLRWRITSTITQSPLFSYIKFHTNRAEFNPDGHLCFYGSSRATNKLPITFGSFQAAANSPANQDLYLGDGVAGDTKYGVGRSENNFVNGATDRQSIAQMIPFDLDTSSKLKIVFVFNGNNASAGDVKFNIRWGISTKDSGLHNSGGAGTVPGGNLKTGLFSFGASDDFKQKYVTIYIDAPTAQFINSGGEPDIFWINFEREGAHVDDTYAGNVAMLDIGVFYHSWRVGCHSDLF